MSEEDHNTGLKSDITSLKSDQLPQPYNMTSNKGGKTAQDTDGTGLSRFNSTILADGQNYTILTQTEKHIVPLILGLCGLASAIGVSIYWISLTQIQHEFGITEEQMNLTITIYLIFQAVAPTVVSNYSDMIGRRPVLLICLLGGAVINVGIALCKKYWLLMFLRALLATFIAPVISLNGAIGGDITTGRDRGSITTITGGCTLIGQGLAPFVGSVLDTAWGWRAIFWFSAAFDGVACLICFILLPETNRAIVGNLSHMPDRFINRSPALLYFGKRLTDTDGDTLEPHKQFNRNPFAAFALLKDPNMPLFLLPCALSYSTWTMTQTTLSLSLTNAYNLTSLKVGLCFFAPGFSTVIGTLITGYVLDKVYRRRKAKYAEKYKHVKDRPPFNVLSARLSHLGIPLALSALATIGYGWVIKFHEPLASVLVTSVLLTLGSMYGINCSLTLMIDLHPQNSGAATAMVNLYRCGLAAIMVSVLNLMNNSMTVGGTYTLMGGLLIGGIVLNYLTIYWSPQLMKRYS